MIIQYGESANDDNGIYYAKWVFNDGEDVIDPWMEEQLWYDSMHKNLETGMWIQKNNKEIHISEMTTSHICNCINMLNRKIAHKSANKYAIKYSKLWIDKFTQELEHRNSILNKANGLIKEVY